MKCGSCRVTDANQYKKINPDDDLFDILKRLNATRVYNPKYAYFCETCIGKATTILAHKLTAVSDQNGNSFTLITGDSTSKASNDTSNSSRDEFDDIVVSKKFYTETGTPIIIPPKRSKNPSTRPKPCPKRFKGLVSIPEGSDRQEPEMPNIATQTSSSSSGAKEQRGLMMSPPSLEDELIEDESDSKRDSASGTDANNSGQDANKSGQDANVSGQEANVSGEEANVLDQEANKSGQVANVSNSSLVVDDRSADSPGDRNSSSDQSKRPLDPNESSSSQSKRRGSPNEVSITSPRRTKESRTEHRQSPTEKSDTESDQSSTNNSRTRAEKSRTQPRRSPTEKSESESDQSASKKARTQPRRPSAEKTRTQPRRASTEKTSTQPSRPSAEKKRTQPRRPSAGKDDTESDQSVRQRTSRRPQTSTRMADSSHDSDTSHDGDGGTLAPAVKNPRIRSALTPMPRNVQEFFSNDQFVEVNFVPRTMAG